MDLRKIAKSKSKPSKEESLAYEQNLANEDVALETPIIAPDEIITMGMSGAFKHVPSLLANEIGAIGPGVTKAIAREMGNTAAHIEGGSIRSLLRRMKNPELTKKAEEFIAKEMPLKDKSRGIERMVKSMKEKLNK